MTPYETNSRYSAIQNENQLKLQLNRLRAHTNPTPISSRMTGIMVFICHVIIYHTMGCFMCVFMWLGAFIFMYMYACMYLYVPVCVCVYSASRVTVYLLLLLLLLFHTSLPFPHFRTLLYLLFISPPLPLSPPNKSYLFFYSFLFVYPSLHLIREFGSKFSDYNISQYS